MKAKYYIPWIIGSLLLCINFLTSCDDDDKITEPPKLFRPQFTDITSSGNWIRATWHKYEGAKSFIVELSLDEFQTEPVASAVVDTTFYTFEDLLWDTEYQIRIKSVGAVVQSDYFLKSGIKTSDYPTKLINPASDDAIDVGIRVKWQIDDVAYTKIEITNTNDEVLQVIDLTPEEYAKGELIVSQLDPVKTYRVKAYTDNEYKGKKTFVTLAAQEFEGTVVDLRDMDPTEAATLITTSYLNELEGNTTIVLAGGVSYTINGVAFNDKAVKFVTGYSFKGMAVLSIDKEFSFTKEVTTPKIEFENVYLTAAGDVDDSTSNYGNKYIFNYNGTGGAGLINFENCHLKYFRGVCRLRGATVIEKAVINNCIVERIAGYAVFCIDDANSTLKDISLTNSTFYFADRVLTVSKSSKTSTVLIRECTFCNTPQTGGYLCDFTNQSPNITIEKNIFGPGKANEGTRYFNAGAGASITSTGNYGTTDYLEFTNDQGVKQYGIPEITTSSVGTFTNPANGDFTINDSKFPGVNTAGDPRWRP